MPESLMFAKDYENFLQSLKSRIAAAQVRAALAVNSELILLYWQIGREILDRQKTQGWGAKVVDQLSKDLRSAFPEMKGVSRANLLYMRRFAETYSDEQFVQQAAGQIPWFHNCKILDKVKSSAEREFYIYKTIENGWSRDVLVWQIESKLFERQGNAVTNFELTLPKPQSDLAHQLLKDPYNFDFLTLHDEAVERDLEKALIANIQKFLLELGIGFAFVGSQYHIEIGGQDFYIDLLFYHLKLRCFVVIDLKMVEFKSEFAGKMNFYLSAVDDLIKHEKDEPTIGLILCKSKNKVVAEYALRDIRKPIGVSEMQILNALPENLKGSLPTIEELEKSSDQLILERMNKVEVNPAHFLQIIDRRIDIGEIPMEDGDSILILMRVFDDILGTTEEVSSFEMRAAIYFRIEALMKLIKSKELPEDLATESQNGEFKVEEEVFIAAANHPLLLSEKGYEFEKLSFIKIVQELLKSESFERNNE